MSLLQREFENKIEFELKKMLIGLQTSEDDYIYAKRHMVEWYDYYTALTKANEVRSVCDLFSIK